MLTHQAVRGHADWAAYHTAECRPLHPREGLFPRDRWQGEVERRARPPSPLAQIRPPCDSTIDLLMAKPMPLPRLCRKNASNIRSALPELARACVIYRDLDLAVLTQLRLHREHAASILCLDAIQHQVHEH